MLNHGLGVEKQGIMQTYLTNRQQFSIVFNNSLTASEFLV